MTTIDLSTNDTKILDAVFDPESSTSTANFEFDTHLPSDAHITHLPLLSTLRAQELAAVRIIEQHVPSAPSSPSSAVSSEAEGEVQPADDKDAPYSQALRILDEIIAGHAAYASAYNNRAQLSRWRYGDRNTLIQAQPHPLDTSSVCAITKALRDLATTITLASPIPGERRVSPSQGRLLAQAWTQRAAIFWQAAKDLSNPGMCIVDAGTDTALWLTWDKTNFEEEASRCFHMAGLYGNEFGKAMAVVTNPHARLCGNIVKEALRRERCG